MQRSPIAASVLAVLIGAAALGQLAAPTPARAAVECGTYASETTPPPTIRVFRTATGAVDTVDFRTYVANVLSREWISSWTTESLRSGALAVKNYAWYQVLHWRGYVNEANECFDVFDSTRDQHYDPSRPTYPSMAAAVDDTWATLALKGGRIFATYYNAGAPNEPCGANVNGWQMFQWGTQACGLAGLSAAQILTTYYTGVTITSAPPPSTPQPTPTATPQPTPQPTPIPPTPGATPNPAPSMTPGATATAEPTATPTPTPMPTPVPTPPPAVPGPGGGQSLAAPPPPPPPNPEPIVVTTQDAADPAFAAHADDLPPAARPSPGWARYLDWSHEAVGPPPTPVAKAPSLRWAWFRTLFDRLLASLVDRWSALAFGPGPAEQPADDQLGGSDVLQGESDRFEDGDGPGWSLPIGANRTNLDEVLFLH